MALNKKKFKKIDKCRISRSKKLKLILDFGSQPLANSLKKTQFAHEKIFPLSVSFCPESSLVQLNQTVDKELLFKDYIWVTGTSSGVQLYAELFSKNLINQLKLQKNDLIIEIASNDGTFLKSFKKKGYNNVLGIDPAKNIASLANKRGITTFPNFANPKIAKKIVNKKGYAKTVIARNVIPHVSELHDVIKCIEIMMGNDGVGIIEFHDVARIFKDLHYDSIYHEHLCFFSIKSMTNLLNLFNLTPYHIENSPISGGSWVIFFCKSKKNLTSKFKKAVIIENKSKINFFSTWKKFAERSIAHRKKTHKFFIENINKKIIGFGSSARSQTYLNFCGISYLNMDAIIDNNMLKQDYYTPGSSIPIVNINQGLNLNPDIIFILAWNFKDEIIQECRNKGFNGKFYIPFPNKPYFHK